MRPDVGPSLPLTTAHSFFIGPIVRDTHRRFDTLHKWCQEWPILSGITLTLIGLVGRCVPVPIYYFGLAKISIR